MQRVDASRRWAGVGAALFLFGCWAGSAAGQEPPALAKSPPEAVNAYDVAAKSQNEGDFEFAFGEWGRFLAKYPAVDLTPKAQYYQGVCALQLKKLPEAQAAFQAVVEKYPAFEFREDALLNLGWCRYQQAPGAGDGAAAVYQQAADAFAQLLKEFPEGKQASQALFFQAESLYLQGKKAEALAPYRQLVDKFAESPLRADAVYALGVTHEELGQYPEAGAVYDLFLKEFAENPLATEVGMRKGETILQAALAAEAGGKPAEAAPLFAQAEPLLAAAAAAQGFPQADHALSRQALCVAKQEKFGPAAALYAKLATDYPQSSYVALAAMAAGRCFYRAEDQANAATWLEKARAAGGADAPEAAHWLCRIQLTKGDAAAAAALAEQALAAAGDSPFTPNLRLDQADALYAIPERRAESLPLYLKLAADLPQHELAPQALYNAAFTALELKQYEPGAAHAAEFLKLFPQHALTPDVQLVAAECQLQTGKRAEAEAAFRELATAYPQRPEREAWRVRLGLCLYLQQKHADTVAELTAALPEIKAPANIAEARHLIGASQLQLDKPAEAAAALQAALAADAKWRQADETLLLLSRAQKKQNQTAEAIATVKQLLADFPASTQAPQATYRLGEYLYAAGDFPAAAAAYGESLTKHPDSLYAPYALYGRGWASMKQNDYAAGATDFTALLEKYPQHALAGDALLARGMCRRRTDDFAGAVADLEAFLKTEPTGAKKGNALFERGLAEVGLKQYPAAVATFTALLAEQPQYAGADKVLYQCAWAHKLQEQEAEATAQFAKLTAEHADSPLAAEAFFHVGEDFYAQQKYPEAAAAYTQAQAKSQRGDLTEKASYKLAWAHYQQQQYEPALAHFTAQTDLAPEGPLSVDGLFMKAECLFKLDKHPEALPAYQAARAAQAKAGDVSPDIQALTLLHAAQSAGQLKQWEESLKLLAELQAKFPASAYQNEAWYETGWAQQNLKKPVEALEAYGKAADAAIDVVGARARFMAGELHFGQKDYPAAVAEFTRVVRGYGAETAPSDIKVWQAKSGYEMARCYDVQIKDAQGEAKAKALAEAKRWYQYVVEKHPGEATLVDTAKKRLEQLAKL